MLIRSKGP